MDEEARSKHRTIKKILLSLQLGKQYMKRGTNMKRLISLILVMLMFISVVFASDDSSADYREMHDYNVAEFLYIASSYLPSMNNKASLVSTTGTGDSQVTVYLLERGDKPSFHITLTGMDKFEIEFVDDNEELELDFARALVFSKGNKIFDYLEKVNTLPNNMLLMSKHTKVYAVVINTFQTLQYFVTRTDYSSYKHHIVLMRETGRYGF